MDSIITGLCFVLLDFNVIYPTRTVDLIPDFIGYILLYRGLKALTERAAALARVFRLSIPLAVLTGMGWLLFALGVLSRDGMTGLLLRFAAIIAALWCAWQLANGIRQLGEYHQIDVEAERLKTAWWWMSVASLLVVGKSLLLHLVFIALTIHYIRRAAKSLHFYRTRCPRNEIPR